ncbi:hypothetical protein JCM10213v2_002133 [Rhodosporidiobolus nylandii]
MLSTSLLTRSLRPSRCAPHLPAVRTFASSPSPLSLLRPSKPLYAASEVAQKPASDGIKDLRQNAAEEARGVVRTVADTVAGANDAVGQRGARENFGAGDASMASLTQQVPKEAITWGAAGLLPYAGTSLSTIYFARQAWQAHELGKEATIDPEAAMALLQHVQLLQVQYGAIILSFLGAVHWGFEWAKYGGVHGNSRYLLGVAPVLAGWSTLLIPGQMALVGQWASFFGMWYVDQKATTKGWTPRWYSTYRFWLTSLVGGSLLLSLAATGYYSVDSNIAKTESQLAELKEGKAPSSLPQGKSVELGEMKAEKGSEGSDAYVKFTNVEKEREQEREKKEEEAKKAEEEEKQKKEDEQQKKEEAEQAKKDEQRQEQKEAEVKKAQAKLSEQVKKVEDN